MPCLAQVPVNLLRAGRIFVFEPPPGVKANMLRTFSSIPVSRICKVSTGLGVELGAAATRTSGRREEAGARLAGRGALWQERCIGSVFLKRCFLLCLNLPFLPFLETCSLLCNFLVT